MQTNSQIFPLTLTHQSNKFPTLSHPRTRYRATRDHPYSLKHQNYSKEPIELATLPCLAFPTETPVKVLAWAFPSLPLLLLTRPGAAAPVVLRDVARSFLSGNVSTDTSFNGIDLSGSSLSHLHTLKSYGDK